MEIFWRLLLGHLLADFTLQTSFINRWKRDSLWGMLVHCALHPACCAALTWNSLGQNWLVLGSVQLPGWSCILILFAVHFIEDQWRVMTIFKYQAPDNTIYFVWDQIIHGAVIFALFPLSVSGASLALPAEKWPVLACLLILVTDACAVTIYFLEKDLRGADFPSPDEKIAGALERLVLALCFLVPGRGWLIAAPAWLALMCILRAHKMLDLSWLSWALGSVAGAACGLFARSVYYS
jgi:hypothetical protein